MSTLQGANSSYLYQAAVLGHQNQRGIADWSFQAQACRKPAVSVAVIDRPDLRYQQTNHLDTELGDLRRAYVISDEEAMRPFLVRQRAIRATLRDAVPKLHTSFGQDCIFSLELSVEEEGLLTLYAVAIWNDDVRSAADAFDNFLESWWLHRMNAATSDLAFAYKLV